MMTKEEELKGLREEMFASQKRYNNAYAKALEDVFEGAVMSVYVHANAETRMPQVVVDFKRFPLEGVEKRISAFDILQNGAAAIKEMVNRIDVPDAVVAEMEHMAVRAVLHDFRLRLKKNPGKAWLMDLRSFVESALVESVQKS
jgi:hypothetical protein